MNPFYSPSGSPSTGAAGLSAVMRAEFLLIAAAFDMMPTITTTGLFKTVFGQQGNFTFTLPSQAGTFALTSDVGAETTARINAGTAETTRALAAEAILTVGVAAETGRAVAAEGVLTVGLAAEANTRAATVTAETNRAVAAEGGLNTQIAGKQPNLGYTPVQQGTGIGQLGNLVKIGWSAAGLRCTVDATDEGLIVTTLNGQGYALTSAVTAETARATAAEGTKQDALGYVPVRAAYSASIVYLGWNGSSLNAQVDSLFLGQVPTQVQPGNFIRNGDNANVAQITASNNILGALGVYASTTATGNGLYLVGDSSTRRLNWTSDGWKLNFDVASGTLAQFNNVGGAVLTLSTNGNLTVPGTMSASNVSDERTKRAITPYRSGLAAIIGLEPVSYQYNGTGGTTDTGKTRWGVTAQQARQFLPEGVSETPEPDADPTLDRAPVKVRLPGQLSFDEQPLLYAMINAFRDVAAELASVKARLATLEGG